MLLLLLLLLYSLHDRLIRELNIAKGTPGGSATPAAEHRGRWAAARTHAHITAACACVTLLRRRRRQKDVQYGGKSSERVPRLNV